MVLRKRAPIFCFDPQCVWEAAERIRLKMIYNSLCRHYIGLRRSYIASKFLSHAQRWVDLQIYGRTRQTTIAHKLWRDRTITEGQGTIIEYSLASNGSVRTGTRRHSLVERNAEVLVAIVEVFVEWSVEGWMEQHCASIDGVVESFLHQRRRVEGRVVAPGVGGECCVE